MARTKDYSTTSPSRDTDSDSPSGVGAGSRIGSGNSSGVDSGVDSGVGSGVGSEVNSSPGVGSGVELGVISISSKLGELGSEIEGPPFNSSSGVGDKVGIIASIELNVFALFTAKAIQLNLISLDASLFKMIVNPLVDFLVTKYLISLAKTSSSDNVSSDSRAILAFTIGCSRYSCSNIISTLLESFLISANPAVSLLKYGLPKKMVSLIKFRAMPAELILSTLKPPERIVIPLTERLPSDSNSLFILIPGTDSSNKILDARSCKLLTN